MNTESVNLPSRCLRLRIYAAARVRASPRIPLSGILDIYLCTHPIDYSQQIHPYIPNAPRGRRNKPRNLQLEMQLIELPFLTLVSHSLPPVCMNTYEQFSFQILSLSLYVSNKINKTFAVKGCFLQPQTWTDKWKVQKDTAADGISKSNRFFNIRSFRIE